MHGPDFASTFPPKETISRQAVVRIFKRAQCAGTQSNHAGSNFGILNFAKVEPMSMQFVFPETNSEFTRLPPAFP